MPDMNSDIGHVKGIHIIERKFIVTDAATNFHSSRERHRPGPFSQTEAWLDARGKYAWIGATILGLIVFWPIGLALLAYMIWSKRMFNTHSQRTRCARSHFSSAMRSSGNSAFGSYKADTLRRLEEEQKSFEEFMERLREAKDKREFDQFMAERKTPASNTTEEI